MPYRLSVTEFQILISCQRPNDTHQCEYTTALHSHCIPQHRRPLHIRPHAFMQNLYLAAHKRNASTCVAKRYVSFCLQLDQIIGVDDSYQQKYLWLKPTKKKHSAYFCQCIHSCVKIPVEVASIEGNKQCIREQQTKSMIWVLKKLRTRKKGTRTLCEKQYSTKRVIE